MRPNIDELSARIFEQNKARGWWDDMNRPFAQTMQLIVTEIAEATEAVRTDAMDHHLPHLPGEAVELADAVIRLLDLAGRYGWKFCDMALPDLDGELLPAEAHWELVCMLADGYPYLQPFSRGIYEAKGLRFTEIVLSFERYCEHRGYDLWYCVERKLGYNATRFDHSREARQADGGKKF